MDLTSFERKLGFSFKDGALLKQALTHRSYINEHKGSKLEHNERLEFLGDAVLELIVTEFLYEEYPKQNEGEMTSFRAALVNADTLSNIASGIGINDHILLSKGEARDTGRARHYILADALEAVIGAIFLDQGYEGAKKFVKKNVLSLAPGIVDQGLWIDSKSLFQEEAQEKAGVTPVYKTLAEEGPDHDKHFTVGVYLGSVLAGQGEGKSKQDAEQVSARDALEKKGWNK